MSKSHLRPEYESRNGMTMCANCHLEFDNLTFFIRFRPATQKYIFIHYDNYDGSSELQENHGKAIALDIKDNRAPLPLLFLIHEYMARGRNFYQPTTTNLEINNNFQDWIVNDGVVNEHDGTFTFNRDAPTTPLTTTLAPDPPVRRSTHLQAPSGTAEPSGSRDIIMPPTADLVEELLAYQRTMPSWKAW